MIHQVALVTDQMSFNPLKKFDVMPQIVVGTPKALESALTKVSFSLVLSSLILCHLLSSLVLSSSLLSSSHLSSHLICFPTLLILYYLISSNLTSYYRILSNWVIPNIITHSLLSLILWCLLWYNSKLDKTHSWHRNIPDYHHTLSLILIFSPSTYWDTEHIMYPLWHYN